MKRSTIAQILPIANKICQKLNITKIDYSYHNGYLFFTYSNPDNSVSEINREGWKESEVGQGLTDYLESL